MAELKPDHLEPALVSQSDADAVLLVVLAVDDRLGPLTVGADDNRVLRCALTFGGEFLVPCVAALQQDAVAWGILDGGFGEGFPWSGTISWHPGQAGGGIVTLGLTDEIVLCRHLQGAQANGGCGGSEK